MFRYYFCYFNCVNGGSFFWLSKTKAGKALRATAENLETASILGVNTKKIILLTVIMASAMGGIAGILVGMAFNSVNPQMGLSMGLKGLAIIILGGMGNVKGAMAGGLILGLAETVVVAYGDSGYRDAIAFIIIIIILLLRPQGLFGQKTSEEGGDVMLGELLNPYQLQIISFILINIILGLSIYVTLSSGQFLLEVQDLWGLVLIRQPY